MYPGDSAGNYKIDLGNYLVNNNATLNYIPKAFFTGIGSITAPNGTIPNPSTTNSGDTTANGLDIMFAPDGTVMSPATNYPIVFWISSTAAFLTPPPSSTPTIDALRGNPSLVAVYPRTGQVISYQVEFDPISVTVPGVGTFVEANAMKDVL